MAGSSIAVLVVRDRALALRLGMVPAEGPEAAALVKRQATVMIVVCISPSEGFEALMWDMTSLDLKEAQNG